MWERTHACSSQLVTWVRIICYKKNQKKSALWNSGPNASGDNVMWGSHLSNSYMARKQLIEDNVIRSSALKRAKCCAHLSVLLQNRFTFLNVEPCMEDGSQLDIEGNTSKNESLVKGTNQNTREPKILAASVQNDIDVVVQDPVLVKAKQQLRTAFGCLPLSSIMLFNCDPTYYSEIPDIIQTHRLVRQGGLPNFGGVKNRYSDSVECFTLEILSQR